MQHSEEARNISDLPKFEKSARRVTEHFRLERYDCNVYQVADVYKGGFFLGSNYQRVRLPSFSTGPVEAGATTTGTEEAISDLTPEIISNMMTTKGRYKEELALNRDPKLIRARIREVEKISPQVETIHTHFSTRPGGRHTPTRAAKRSRLLLYCNSSRTAVDEYYGLPDPDYATFLAIDGSDENGYEGDESGANERPMLGRMYHLESLTPSRMSTPTFVREEDRLVAQGYYDLTPCVAHQSYECTIGECPGCAWAQSRRSSTSVFDEPITMPAQGPVVRYRGNWLRVRSSSEEARRRLVNDMAADGMIEVSDASMGTVRRGPSGSDHTLD